MCQEHAYALVVSATAAGGATTAATTTIRVNPGMSAYTHVYQGQHDYNKHPFVPMGMEAMVHKKNAQTSNVCTTLQEGICPGHIVRALPMPNNMDGGLAQSADIRSSLVQAQVPHPPISHSSRQDHGSYWRPSEDAYHWSPTATTRRNVGQVKTATRYPHTSTSQG